MDNHYITALHFLLQNTHFCIDINVINKVLPLMLLEEVPDCPDYFVGLMNVAGVSTPVVDLSMRLGLKRIKPFFLDQPIILCQHQNHKAGFIVDKIFGLIQVDKQLLQMKSDFSESMIQGTFMHENEMILVLDMLHLLEFNVFDESILSQHAIFFKNSHESKEIKI